MPTRQEPDQPANDQRDSTAPETTVNLVDLFDQMDRSSFLRALEQRDNIYAPGTSDG